MSEQMMTNSARPNLDVSLAEAYENTPYPWNPCLWQPSSYVGFITSETLLHLKCWDCSGLLPNVTIQNCASAATLYVGFITSEMLLHLVLPQGKLSSRPTWAWLVIFLNLAAQGDLSRWSDGISKFVSLHNTSMLASLLPPSPLLPQFLFAATSTVDQAHTYISPLLKTPPVLLYMVINFKFQTHHWSTNTSLEHKHIRARTCLRTHCVFLDACSLWNHSLQPLWALSHIQHGVINLMSTFQILSHPLLTSPTSRMATRQPTAFRTTCTLASPLPFVLCCQTRPTTLSTQQQLPTVHWESAKTHSRAWLHQSDAIWDLMPMLRPHTHHPHPCFWESPPINQLFQVLAWRLSISTHRLIHHSTQLLVTQTVSCIILTLFFYLLPGCTYKWWIISVLPNWDDIWWGLWGDQAKLKGTSSWSEFDYFSAQASLTLACSNTNYIQNVETALDCCQTSPYKIVPVPKGHTIIYLVVQIFWSKQHSASRNKPIFIILLPMERPDS